MPPSDKGDDEHVVYRLADLVARRERDDEPDAVCVRLDIWRRCKAQLRFTAKPMVSCWTTGTLFTCVPMA